MMFRFTFEGRDAAVVDVRTSAIFGQTYRPMRVREAGTLVGSAHTFNFANGGTGSFDVTVVDGVATIDVNASGGGGGDVPGSRQVIAGAGLTGGGDLTADRTINAAANADGSIVVNANDIQVGVLASDAQHGVRGGGTQHAAATTGAAGFMSAADKTALDGIPATVATAQAAADAAQGDIDTHAANTSNPHSVTHTQVGAAAASHTHAAADITSGVIAIARLATGTPDGTKFIRDDGTLAVPPVGGGTYAWTRDDKRLAALVTAGDNDPAIASGITNTPENGYVMVTVNGVEVSVGDGSKAGVDCYFSADAGVTPRALTAVVQGDTLHWNGSVAGFQLTTADRISMHYLE